MRGQSNFLDFIVAFFIFVIVLTITFTYARSAVQVSEPPDVDRIASDVLSDGIPNDWNTSNVVLPGVLTDGQLDENKWNNLSALSDEDMREKLLLAGDVYVRALEHNGTHYETVLPDITSSALTYDDIGELTSGSVASTWRIVAYNGSLVAIEVIGWP